MNARKPMNRITASKPHGTYEPQTRLLPYGEGYLLSDGNLFLEAVELLCSLGELVDTLGKVSQVHPEQISNALLQQLECYNNPQEAAVTELTETTLRDFGEFLMIRGIYGKCDPTNPKAFALLNRLLQAKTQPQFVQCLVEIKQFCAYALH